jgi:tetratricopeptide (TPR) repeat protein
MIAPTTELTHEELAAIQENCKALKALIESGDVSTEVRTQYCDALEKLAKSSLEDIHFEPAVRILRELLLYSSVSPTISANAGWLIFAFLKHLAGDEQLKKQFASAIPEFLDAYSRLGLETPSQLHSAIVFIANKLAGEHTDWFFPFFRKYGFTSLQAADFQEHQKDGRKYQPLAEQLFIKTARTVEKTKNEECARWLLENIVIFHDRAPGETWLHFHEGLLLMQLGRYNEARIRLRETLMKQKNQFWVWAGYGATFKTENPDIHLACLCKALSFPVEEHLLYPIREEIALVFAARGMFPEAKTEIEFILRARSEHGYQPAAEFLSLLEKEWYPSAAVKTSNISFYLAHLAEADSLFHDGGRSVPGVVTAMYDDDKGVFIQFEVEKATLYKLPRGAAAADLPKIGDIVAVFVEELMVNGKHRYSAIKWEPGTQTPSEKFFKYFHGDLKLPAKSDGAAFGFVGDVFVSADLTRKIGKPLKVKGEAVYEFNKKRNQFGWKALTIEVDPSAAESKKENGAPQHPAPPKPSEQK